MAQWYDRVKGKMKIGSLRQEDLMPVFGVTTRGAVGHYLSGRRDPSPTAMVALADKLNMTLDEMLRGTASSQSQELGINLPMLSEALVSLDKALRAKGLEYDAAYVAPALMLAYRERLKHPEKLDRAAYALYDRLVLEQLQGQQDRHERRSEGQGIGGVGEAAPARKAARRGQR